MFKECIYNGEVSLAVTVVAYLAFDEMHWEVATSLEFSGPSFLAWE